MGIHTCVCLKQGRDRHDQKTDTTFKNTLKKGKLRSNSTGQKIVVITNREGKKNPRTKTKHMNISQS